MQLQTEVIEYLNEIKEKEAEIARLRARIENMVKNQGDGLRKLEAMISNLKEIAGRAADSLKNLGEMDRSKLIAELEHASIQEPRRAQ